MLAWVQRPLRFPSAVLSFFYWQSCGRWGVVKSIVIHPCNSIGAAVKKDGHKDTKMLIWCPMPKLNVKVLLWLQDCDRIYVRRGRDYKGPWETEVMIIWFLRWFDIDYFSGFNLVGIVQFLQSSNRHICPLSNLIREILSECDQVLWSPRTSSEWRSPAHLRIIQCPAVCWQSCLLQTSGLPRAKCIPLQHG